MTSTNRQLVTFTAQAYKRITENMDDKGTLARDARVSLECVRATWVADANERIASDGVILPKGCDMDSIADMLAWVAQVRGSDSKVAGWRMPPLSTAHLCDDGRLRTVGQMLEGISLDLMPRDDVDFEMLMACFGCDWTHPLAPMMHPHGFLTMEQVPSVS